MNPHSDSMTTAKTPPQDQVPAADLAVLRQTLAEQILRPSTLGEYFASSHIGDITRVGWSSANVAAVRKLLRDHYVDFDLRIRCWASMVRHRRLWYVVRAAWFRQAERRVARYFPDVHAAQLAARADGGLTSRSQFARLWEIALLLEHFRPTSCLEFGTGASTAMLASEMRSRGTLLSVEESPYWHTRVQAYLHRFAEGTISIQADKALTEFDGEPVVHYAVPHDNRYDFVYVDGPANEPPDTLTEKQRIAAFRMDERGRLANVDIELMWQAGVFPRVIALDGRLSTLRRWIRTGIERYDLYLKSDYYAAATGRMPPYVLHHTLLVLRDLKAGH